MVLTWSFSQRNHTSINAASHAIPYFKDDESWYRYVGGILSRILTSILTNIFEQTKLSSSTWWERYIELGNAQ